MSDVVATNQTILVVGAGISGITAAVEAAETGKQVILVEQRPLPLTLALSPKRGRGNKKKKAPSPRLRGEGRGEGRTHQT